jgi:hypothetical protein
MPPPAPPPPRRGAAAITLDVTTYREGFLRLQGWTCVSLLTFLTGALLVLYEVRRAGAGGGGGGGGGRGGAGVRRRMRPCKRCMRPCKGSRRWQPGCMACRTAA